MKFEQVKRNLEVDGFHTARGLLGQQELSHVESLIDAMMFKPELGAWKNRRELAYDPSRVESLQPELVRPTKISKQLRGSGIFRVCRQIAEQVFDSRAHYLFDHAIYKMPRNETVTPWHQDQAYLGNKIEIKSLHFWIPFQETNEGNGSLRFVPGSHHALLPHGRPFEGNSHLLAVDPPARDDIHEVVVGRGDLSIHTNLTLHAAHANHSDQIRKAWVLHFGNRSALYKRWLQLKSRFL